MDERAGGDVAHHDRRQQVAQTKVRPFIYLNQSQVKNFNWQSVVDGSYALWIAAYLGSPTNNNFTVDEFKSAAMQQWTSSQQVPGISGNVDGNVFFGDLATLKKYGFKPVAPAPVPPTPPAVVSDPETKLTLGKVGDVDYGEKKLREVREIIASFQVSTKALQGEVDKFTRLKEAIHNMIG